MDASDQEKVRRINLAQLAIDENSLEAEKRREERRQDTVREKQRENDRLDFQRYRNEADRSQLPNFRAPNQYWLSPQDKLILEFYESRCAEKIKKRSSIMFSNHLVDPGIDGPAAPPNVIFELTKWVKIALSKKKFICAICNNRTLPQRCTKECFFFHKNPGCLAGQLCHSRHGSSPDDLDTQSTIPPLFLTT